MGRSPRQPRPVNRARRVALAAIVVLISLPLAPAPDAPTAVGADSLPPVAVVVRGKGNGHGRGLSQWGAYGWATVFNSSWRDILAFYYGGGGRNIATLDMNSPADAARASMSVRLQALDSTNTSVVSDTASATWVGKPGAFSALVAVPVGRNLYDVYSSTSAKCAASSAPPAGFSLIGDNVKGPVEFATPRGSDPLAAVPADLLGVCEPPSSSYKNGRVRYYRGSVRAVNDSKGNRRTANVVATDLYLRGVVPRESPAGWGDAAGGLGMNALRAQAVAARSYSMSETRYSYAKTCDTQDCQVYGGAAIRNVGSKTSVVIEDPRTNRAIDDTAGVVIKDRNNTVVRTEFTSSNGGRTAGGQFPAKSDAGDLAANAVLQSWSRTFTAEKIQKMYPSIGVLLSISTRHDGLGGDWDGYATSVTITGAAGTVTRTGWEFRSDFDLNSPWYETFPVSPAEPNAAEVGPILYIGDSVSESIATEFASVVTPAYPKMTYQACAGRGMAGQACMFDVASPELDLDGAGVANALPAPAIAVIALGYNDNPGAFDAELQQMISVLTTKGVGRMIFVNLSTRAASRNYAKSNASLVAAATANPAVTILDWNAASSGADGWRWFDNTSLCCWVHLSTTGQTEFTLFLRQQLDSLRAQGLLPVASTSAPVVPGLPLTEKNEGQMVVAVQKKLNTVLKLTQGKDRLVTDGIYGRATARKVRAFQRANSLPVTGTVDRTTWETLWSGPRPDLAVLSRGTTHPAVAAVQRALGKVLKVTITPSGRFDSRLVTHVRTFQKRAKLRQSGKVGPTTWAVLMNAASRTP